MGYLWWLPILIGLFVVGTREGNALDIGEYPFTARLGGCWKYRIEIGFFSPKFLLSNGILNNIAHVGARVRVFEKGPVLLMRWDVLKGLGHSE